MDGMVNDFVKTIEDQQKEIDRLKSIQRRRKRQFEADGYIFGGKMEVEKITVLRLSEKESDALKKMLGSLSGDNHVKIGKLSPDESKTVSDIYNVLEHPEDRVKI